MKTLREIFRRRAKPDSDLFDIQHAKTMAALRATFGLEENAGLTSDRSDDGAATVEYYLHHPEVQQRYPLGLLPMGQKRFVKWLLGKGRSQHQLSETEVIRFLHETAENLPRMIALTYLVNPEWQRKFPADCFEAKRLLIWLRSEFPRYAPLRKIAALPMSLPDRPTTARGVNILSHFCYPSGLQQAALATKTALEAAGWETSCRDVPTGVRTELSAREPWLELEKFPISLTNVAPVPHFQNRYQRAGLCPRPGVRTIAHWAWELDAIPEEWKQLASSLHEIWTTTPFVAEAMRGAMPVPVYDMLPGVSIGPVEKPDRANFGLTEDDLVFLFMFDMCSDFRRKNPLAVVRAFQRAFQGTEQARLVIKLSRGESDPANLQLLKNAATDRRIVIVDELVSRAQAYGFIAMSDCVISLHRSEGLGLLMAEAMLLGKPVIATNYSGNTAFMTSENSLLVDYDLVTIEQDGAIYKKGNRWAEPSEEHAARLMRRVYENRDEAATLGLRGQKEASELLSIAAAGARMTARLDAITYSPA